MLRSGISDSLTHCLPPMPDTRHLHLANLKEWPWVIFSASTVGLGRRHHTPLPAWAHQLIPRVEALEWRGLGGADLASPSWLA